MGINDTTPSSSLDVTGDINCTGIYRMDGSIVVDSGRTYVGSGGINTSGVINTSNEYRIDGVDVINTARTFVGSGGIDTSGNIFTDGII